MKVDTSSSIVLGAPKSLPAMTLKKQLRFYLDMNDMTASQLAKKAAVPKQSLSGWLAGSNPRDVRQVKRVADALGITVDNLLFADGVAKSEMPAGFETGITEDWMSGLFEIKIRKVKRQG